MPHAILVSAGDGGCRSDGDVLIDKLIAKARKLAGILAAPEWRRALLRHRVAAGVEHGPVLHGVADFRTVVDIGANRGQFALLARRLFPAARIISFEPLEAPANTLDQVFATDAATVCHRAAIAAEAGEKTIHVSRSDDSSSLLPITAVQRRLFPGTEEAHTATIRSGRLGDFVSPAELARPALLKMDVQGYELQALQGCEELLDRFDYVYAECSFIELYEGQGLADGVIAWLRERDFAMCGVYNVTYDARGKAVQADFLFRRRPREEAEDRDSTVERRYRLAGAAASD